MPGRIRQAVDSLRVSMSKLDHLTEREDRGKFQGSCGNICCQMPLTINSQRFNPATNTFYCVDCADRVNAPLEEAGEGQLCIIH